MLCSGSQKTHSMAGSPRVSVVMGTYNEEGNIQSSVQSILDQTFVDFEFIVVDDGSTDRTVELLKAYEEDRLRLLRNESNCGLTRTLNRGMAAARGKFVARMDADDRSLPERLERQVEWLEDNQAVAVASWYRIMGQNDEWVCDQRISPDRSFSVGNLITENQAVAHGSVMLRKAALEAVDGYCERFTLSQDRDLWFRLAAAFGPEFMGIVDEVLYEYSVKPGDFKKRPRQNFYGSCATLRAAVRSLTGRDPPHEFERSYLRDRVDHTAYELPQTIAESRYWEFVGKSLLYRGETRQGYRCLLRSLRAEPKNIRAWYRLFESVLGWAV